MKIIYSLPLLLITFSSGFAQATVIPLADSLKHAKKVSFRAKEQINDIGQFAFPEEEGGLLYENNVSAIVRLKPSDFLWGKQVKDDDYYSLFFATVSQSFGPQFIRASEKELTFSPYNKDAINLADSTFLLSFSHRTLDKSLDILVHLELNENGEFLFYPYQLFSGTIELKDTTISFQVWPYQAGPVVKIGPDSSFSLMKIEGRLEMGEDFILNEQVFEFSNFNYLKKQITLNSKPGTKVLYGYKTGRIVESWQKNTSLWKKRGIATERPALLYFGGSWCGPCLEELPRLKAISNLCSKKDIATLSIAVEREQTAEQGWNYLETNAFPGRQSLELLGEEDALHRELNVFSYPTYIFIDSNGEILFRADTRGARDKYLHGFITDYLNSN